MRSIGWQMLLSLVLLLGINSCVPFQKFNFFDDGDLHPPVLLGGQARDAHTLVVEFDEMVVPLEGTVQLSPTLEIAEVRAEQSQLLITTVGELLAGEQYRLQASVDDQHGNSTDFLILLYGFNAQVPHLLINEFIVEGTAKNPDLVEIYVASDGDLAGVSIYDGSPSNWDDFLILPSRAVEAGDWVLIHFKPENIVAEINETESKGQSGGLNASDQAWDFWVSDGDGLSATNGVLAVTTHPGGALLDAVIYSNRTSESDTKYRGFGTRATMERVDEVVALGGWQTDGDMARPEDAVEPTDSTSTRSISRDSASSDSDHRRDWHIVPTRGKTFGATNTDEVHQPK